MAVLSDTHLSKNAEGTWKLLHRTEERLNTAIQDINRHDVDITVMLGDLTKDGEPWNVRLFDEIIKELRSPTLAVPGNHDVPKSADNHNSMGAQEFANRYSNGSLPFETKFGELTFLGLNTATMPDNSLSDTWAGELSPDQIEWLDCRLEAITHPIIVQHHNAINLHEHPNHYHWEGFAVRNRAELMSICEKHNARVIMSGHHHLPCIHSQNGIFEIISPSTSTYLASYLLITIEDGIMRGWLIPLCGKDGMLEARSFGYKGSTHGKGIAELNDIMLCRFPWIKTSGVNDL